MRICKKIKKENDFKKFYIEKLPNKITNIKIIFKYTIIQIILFKIKQIKSKIKISSSNVQSYFFYFYF